ncbi:MMPL family transporter [Puerhibacterium puerhi]|uniref:MMPL family transporter n=1 Tax=Puerhibacterium puerhi TaxID=2692623 RepID=UPI0013568964|nr:MMPL family transporter [Puerhibacterium puerhi]
MAELLYRVGRACARHARAVIAAWAAVLVLAGGAFALFGGTLASSFDIPGTPTAQVTQKLQDALPDASGGTGRVVLRTTDGAAFTEAQRAEIVDRVAQAAGVDGVAQVVDPFTTEAELAKQAQQVADGRAQIASGREQVAAGREQLDGGQAQLDAARQQAEVAGQAATAAPQLDAQQAQLDAGRAELEEQAAQLEEQAAALEDGARLLELADGIRTVSQDGSAAIVTVAFTEPQLDVSSGAKQGVLDAFDAAPIDGVQVDASSELLEAVPSVFGPGEAVGLVVAAVVLVVMLGTLVAAGLPILNALIGVGVGAMATMALSGVVQMASVTPILGLMLGLAVGIDYTLFIVNRHRRQLKDGYDVDESIALANGTSGNAVVFAGATVLIALLALNVTGIPFLGLMGSAGALCIAVAVLVAVTFTPAVLRLVGPRVLSRTERAALTSRGAAPASTAGAAQAAPVARPAPMRTGRAVLRVVVGVGALAVVALPALDLRLNLPDGSSEAHDSTQYQAYATVAEKFGEGQNGTLLVVADLPAGLDDDAVAGRRLAVAERLHEQDDVVAVAPIGAAEDNSLLAFQVVPAEGPTSESTERLVHTLRGLDLDGVSELGVAGSASGNVDISDKLADALPTYLAVVVGLSLLILVLVFRSLYVPVIATLGFVLSYFATLGGTVWIYQWGNLAGLFGVETPGPILNFLPTILVGILFGLAMDYMLFLTSGMREAYAHGAPARLAVVQGVRAGRAVVVAAALIMISVFGGFMFSHSAMIRPIGFALAFGVLVDAFGVRMLIVPALMHLAGDKAWWLPRWLDRLLPDVDVEGASLERRHPHHDAVEPAAQAEAAASEPPRA